MASGNVYAFKRRPYKHQVAALKNLLRREWGGALLMEPRTGKTKVACDWAGINHLYFGVNRILIVGPVVAIEVWKRELEANLDMPYRLTIWDREGRQAGILPSYGKDILDIIIMNYDAFSTPGQFRRDRKTGAIVTDSEGNKLRSKTRGGRYDVIKSIQRWQPQAIILDESHRIKTPSSKKSRALHRLGPLAEKRVILTGTPITKSKRLFDAYSQWQFLNPQRFGGMTFAEFKQEYGRWMSMDKWQKFLGTKNENQLHDLMHMDAYSVTREECYDLPKQTTQIIPVPLEESGPVYDRMAEDMVARIESGEITEASIKLVQGLRLQQIASGLAKTNPTPEHPNGRLQIIGSEKLRAIEDRLEDLMEADEKVVIGAQFKGDIARLIALGKKLKVPTFAVHGGVKASERARMPEDFRKVAGGAIFIGQPAAAGEAIDLSCASILQWYSLPTSWVQYRQFTDRIALSDRPTFFEYFLAANTIDFMRYQTLMEDGDIGKMMIQSPELLLRTGATFASK